jgi:hypothetical protein
MTHAETIVNAVLFFGLVTVLWTLTVRALSQSVPQDGSRRLQLAAVALLTFAHLVLMVGGWLLLLWASGATGVQRPVMWLLLVVQLLVQVYALRRARRRLAVSRV